MAANEETPRPDPVACPKCGLWASPSVGGDGWRTCGHCHMTFTVAPGAAPAAETPRCTCTWTADFADHGQARRGPHHGKRCPMHTPAPAAETPRCPARMPGFAPAWCCRPAGHMGDCDFRYSTVQGPAPAAETPPPAPTLQEMGAAFAERLRLGGAAPETIAAYERAVETTIARYMGWPLPADPRDQTIRQMHEDSLAAVRETAAERDAARAALAALRARVEALADEWEKRAEELKIRRWPEAQAADEAERDAMQGCADDLRAALSGEGP